MFRTLGLFFLLLAAHCFTALEVHAQSTEFSFQGLVKDGADPGNGNYDFQFRLFDQPTGGIQIGTTLQRLSVPVVQGNFTVSLDFGAAAFNGSDRLIGIDVRPSGGGAFTTLSPRQKVNSAPYSVRSLNSGSADQATNAAQLGGVAAGQYVITTDPRMSDARTPLAGSSNYIQNTTSAQASSNFNISGTGTAGIIRANTQYNLGGNRFIFSLGSNNLYVGIQAGLSHTTASHNAVFGMAAGVNNSTGSSNSIFCALAGFENVSGTDNSFFGRSAGFFSTASNNSFFGSHAGENTTTGGQNSFFGKDAGLANSLGSINAFFGNIAGTSNTLGVGNAFFGSSSGRSNTSGSFNAFFGQGSGDAHTLGSNNTFIGRSAGSSEDGGNGISLLGSLSNASDNQTNATAIGFQALVTQSNSLVLGSISGVNGATANTLVGIGTTAPQRRLHVSNGPSGASPLGSSDVVVEDNAAAFQHFLTPDDNESGILFGDPTDSIGGGIVFNNPATNNGIMFRSGGNSTRMVLDGSGNLGLGILAPLDRLDVIGSIRVSALGAAGATHLCRNASNQISTCTSLRPDVAGSTATDVEELRTQITELKTANAEQQKLIDKQRVQIDALLRIACSQTSDPAVCRP